KEFRSGSPFVPANADAHNVAVAIADCEFEDRTRGLHAEMTHSVEDPKQRDSEVTRAAFTSALQSLADGGKVLLAPQAHTYRRKDLGVQNIFCFQFLHQAVGDQFVIVAGLQVFRNVLERNQKS